MTTSSAPPPRAHGTDPVQIRCHYCNTVSPTAKDYIAHLKICPKARPCPQQ